MYLKEIGTWIYKGECVLVEVRLINRCYLETGTLQMLGSLNKFSSNPNPK